MGGQRDALVLCQVDSGMEGVLMFLGARRVQTHIAFSCEE